MVTTVKNASECIRTSLQYYPENMAHKYDKDVHNQVLCLCSTLVSQSGLGYVGELSEEMNGLSWLGV